MNLENAAPAGQNKYHSARLKQALGQVEVALAILVDRQGLDADAALDALMLATEHTGLRLVEVARHVVDHGALPEIREASIWCGEQSRPTRREQLEDEMATRQQAVEVHLAAAAAERLAGRHELVEQARARAAYAQRQLDVARAEWRALRA